MNGPLDGGRNGDRGGADEPDGVRGIPRIPGQRAAADDLDPPSTDVLRRAVEANARAARAAEHSREREEPDEPDATDEADDADEARTADKAAGVDSGADADTAPGTPPEPAHPPEPAGERELTGGRDPYGPPPPRPPAEPVGPPPSHSVLKSLLGAWALAACSPEETTHVENHLTECAPCADEALKLRDAVGLLQADRNLDLPPLLRSRVLENCLGRRAARIPVPLWATPYDAETARLDALLRDFGDAEWHAPLQLKWFEKEEPAARRATVAGVIGHLMTVDGLVASALGLDDPLGEPAPQSPTDRTEAFWRRAHPPPTRTIREPWRDQSHTLIRTVSFAGRGVAELSVPYGEFALPLRDAMIDRAFECWIHGVDIAEAVDYPYPAPSGPHLHEMIDLAAQLIPSALAARRRAGLASPAHQLVVPGSPGRSLHLEVEGPGGGNWYIALDSPAAVGTAERAVAQVALDGVEFCQLVAGHISPEEAAAGQDGDREAIRDVLFAAASLSRL
ncbi:maleylpyruvate isomerase N-terminal domain-containing protein [Streptomyces sp. NBC_01725]|uniref:maleylpyruvate isomerase N-terminal domain-containing protein n=1 Tax=Streptomyces sp. NBC_01725 TaxID=2975923 RepID=UPI002E29B597|nr:maleylpyruvate isomerase N-terminal domain-containing protein [Streptomyces sp. NBC_01725]